MALAVYGKHPAKGDFVEQGVPANLKPQLEAWLDQVLAEARHGLGEAWESVWRGARPVRFWLGEAIWGERVCGVLMASADKVGRRFPLVIFAYGEDVPSPVVAPDQQWYCAMEAHLRKVARLPAFEAPADLLIGAPLVPGEASLPAPPDFWAVRPGEDVAGLWADLGLTDHSRASLARSYWWAVGDPPSAEPEPAAAAIAPDAERGEDAGSLGAAEEALPEIPLPKRADEPPGWESPQDDDSPFATGSDGPALFAPPEIAAPAPLATPTPVADVVPTKPAVKPAWTQLWAGHGLPSGHVIAWFLRGYDGNG